MIPQPKIKGIYNYLLELYGPQGWWPLIELHNILNKNPTKTGSLNGYHPRDYTYPKIDNQCFEICIGAILTQNTSWPNVEKALLNLQKNNLLSPQKILDADTELLKNCIKPAGYFNQKAKKLKIFSDFYINLNNSIPKRDQLLNLWGIGPETADSILLYAFKTPTFVVDAYTRRILANLNMIDKKSDYNHIKTMIEQSLEPDTKTYQEFHALIVEHAKRFYSGNNNPVSCPLKTIIKYI